MMPRQAIEEQNSSSNMRPGDDDFDGDQTNFLFRNSTST